MKKFLAFALVLITLTVFVGCNAPQVELTRGTIDGDVYKNEVLGFEFNKPRPWVYYTDEEIAETMDFAVENLINENFKEALENSSAIYDMMAVHPASGANISVSYENLKKTHSTRITVEQYVEALEEQFPNVSSMTVTFPDELETAKLGNTEFTKCVCSVSASGVSMTQVYYLSKIGDYMAVVIATIPSGSTVNVETIEGMFK